MELALRGKEVEELAVDLDEARELCRAPEVNVGALIVDILNHINLLHRVTIGNVLNVGHP